MSPLQWCRLMSEIQSTAKSCSYIATEAKQTVRTAQKQVKRTQKLVSKIA